MVGGYTENLEKPQTVKIGGWALAQDITVLHVHVCGLETHIAAQVWLKLASFPDWLGNEARLKQIHHIPSKKQQKKNWYNAARGIRNIPQLCDVQMWSEVKGQRSKILHSYSNVVY